MPGPGELLGDSVGTLFGSALDQFYRSIWNGAQALMRGSFGVADRFTTFSLSDGDGLAAGSPLTSVWPTMKYVAMAVALGLFFTQLILTALRGGRGMFRAVTGPAQFAMAMALTVGGVGALLAATDGLTTVLLQAGLKSGNFVGVLDVPAVAARMGQSPDLGDIAGEDVRATVLAFTALFGFIPASISFALQMIFRQAAVLVLVATLPVTAAGLLSEATSAWFWRALRWIIAAALIKPALALVLVIGINMLSSSTGVAGLIAGATVLLISVFAPMTLYRLLAFVDPATGHGQAIRSPSQRRSTEPSSDGGASEATNAARFADAGGGISPASTGPTAAGGSGAGGAGATGGGAVAGAGAIAGLAIQAGRAVNGWSNNRMTQFAVGHPGSATSGSGAHGGLPRGRTSGSAASGSESTGPDVPDLGGGGPADDGPRGDERDRREGGAVSAPPASSPRADALENPREDDVSSGSPAAFEVDEFGPMDRPAPRSGPVTVVPLRPPPRSGAPDAAPGPAEPEPPGPR